MTERTAKASLQLAVCALALVACKPDDDPATQLIVSINSNLEAGAELSRVRIEIKETTGSRTSTPRTFNLTGSNRVSFPFSFGIQKGSASRVTVIATGFGPTGDGSEGAVIERKENARFRDGEAMLLKIFLDDVCLGKLCSSTETCQQRGARLATPGECAAIREPTLTAIEPGDEDDAWDEDGGASGQGAGQGGASGQTAGGEGGQSGEGAGGQGGAGMGGAGGAGTGGTAGMPPEGCDPPCSDGEECVELTCVCTAGMHDHYADTDQDGFGNPNDMITVCGDGGYDGYVNNDLDCCDGDEDVNPDITVPSFLPSLCGDGSDGVADWDHNCDGEIEGYQALFGGVCCDDSIGWTNGWAGAVPFCGQSGAVMICDTQSTCAFQEEQALQECL